MSFPEHVERTCHVVNKTGEAYTEKYIGHRDHRDPEALASPRKQNLFRLTIVVTS